MTDRQRENEEKKEYLKSYQRAKLEAHRCEEAAAELRVNKLGPTTQQISFMPSSHNQKDLSDYIVYLGASVDRFIKARYKAVNLYTEIYKQIELLDDEKERTVLTYRYLNARTWEWIAERLDCSVRQIYRLHGIALRNFKKK